MDLDKEIDNLKLDKLIISDIIIEELDNLVIKLSNNFTQIIPRDIIKKYDILNWGDNGIGDRWAKKKFNYSVIYKNGKINNYSENINDKLDTTLLENFLQEMQETNNKGIIGIFVYSKRLNIEKHPISKKIDKEIKKRSCVSCGSKYDIICDHKNDLYNNSLVLDLKTQCLDDFQPLCNHCNLQKRQISKEEKLKKKIYSAKNLDKYQIFPFEFPWEKKIFDINDIYTKNDTYWYDPVEFNNKIYLYITYRLPFLNEIKKFKKN